MRTLRSFSARHPLILFDDVWRPDPDAVRALLAEAQAQRGDCPCEHFDHELRKECPTPAPHTTCECPCFSFRGCTDPTCDHPACEGVLWRRFSDLFEERFPDDAKVRDVMVAASPPFPAVEFGRHDAMLADKGYRKALQKDDVQKLGTKMYERLRKKDEWVCLYSFPGVPAERAGGALDVLLVNGTPVLAREVCYRSRSSIAMRVAEGAADDEGGGMFTVQVKLDPAGRSAEHVPVGAQSALF